MARRRQIGQMLPLMALLLVGLLGFSALAIDAGQAYLYYLGDQNAADAAAISGADQYFSFGQSSARQVALSNVVSNTKGTAIPGGVNYAQDISNLSIGNGYTVSITLTTSGSGENETVLVKSSFATVFARFLGFSTANQAANAMGYAGPGSDSAAVLALAAGTCANGNQAAITINGGAADTITGNVISNGNIYAANNANVNVTGNLTLSGCFTQQTPNHTGSVTTGAPNTANPNLPEPGPEPATDPSAHPPDPHYTGANADPVELTPQGVGNLKVDGGCYFLDPGVYEFWGNNKGYTQTGGYVTNFLSPPGTGDLWNTQGCFGSLAMTLTTYASGQPLDAGSYSIVVTSVRTNDNGFSRESAVSTQCLSVVIGDHLHGFSVNIPNIPGAQQYNVYAGTSGCSGPYTYEDSGPVVFSPQTQNALGTTQIRVDESKLSAQQPPGSDNANQDYSVVSGGKTIVPGAVVFNFEPTSAYSVTGGSGTQMFSGDQYDNIIVWGDPGNSGNGCTSTFAGGTNATLYGIFYMPGCSITFTGGSGPALQGELIGNTITVNGGAAASLAYNADFSLPPPTTVLTQ